MKSDGLRIIVLGSMGRMPFGGHTWVHLNWLHAFAALGHAVWYVEDDLSWFYDPERNATTDDATYAVRHVSDALRGIGLDGRWALRLGRDGDVHGLGAAALGALYAGADVAFNVGGATDLLDHPALAVRTRVYLETDPVAAELRLASGDAVTRARFACHDRFATYGENYGASDCAVPVDGMQYVKTRQPVSLEHWPFDFRPGAASFTTIGNYRQPGYDVEWNGTVYRWSKHYEWERFAALPARVEQRFEVALVVRDPADREFLRRHGWHLISPLPFSLDAFGGYRDFIRASRGEFTVAKDQNVRLRSGWFSDRDATYLACGKPIVVQETGFGAVLPEGKGLFGFSTIDEAVAAVEAINADYPAHCRAAREIAEEYFDAPRVARRLLDALALT